MNDVIELIRAIKDLIIPVSVLILVIVLIPSIKRILEVAQNRSIKIKIGENEIEIGNLLQQQNAMIGDLQKKVLGIEDQADVVMVNRSNQAGASKTILWVDDYPINNAALAENFRAQGFQIDNVLSTKEATRMLSARDYGIVISDMGRLEDGARNPIAGLELAKSVKGSNSRLPVAIYTTRENCERYRSETAKIGAKITASGAELVAIVYSAFGLKK